MIYVMCNPKNAKKVNVPFWGQCLIHLSGKHGSARGLVPSVDIKGSIQGSVNTTILRLR